MKKKITALALILALFLGVLLPAQAETEYPPRPSGTVADLAGVLGDKTAADLEELSQRLEAATGGHIFVLTRHFLGGDDAQRYADKVFEVWSLNPQDVLLLMVIGEENYALALGREAGAALPSEARNTLLGAFRNAYLARQYDGALADLALSLAKTLAKAGGTQLDSSGLLGVEAVQSTPQPQTVDDYWYGMFARDDYDALEDDDAAFWRIWQDERRSEESSINWRSVIIWALVIYFLFFRRKKSRSRR